MTVTKKQLKFDGKKTVYIQVIQLLTQKSYIVFTIMWLWCCYIYYCLMICSNVVPKYY